jgi:alkaline phosphatase D
MGSISRHVAVLATLMSFLPLQLNAVPVVTNAIVVGGVTHNSARFWVRTDAGANVSVELSTSPNFLSSFLSNEQNVLVERNFAAIMSTENLQPNTRYYYRARVNGVAQDRVGSFMTFPLPGSASTFTFAFGSCQQGKPFVPSPNPSGKVYREVIRANPRFFLQIGDWGYPDTTDRIPTDSNFFAYNFSKVQQTYLERTVPQYPMDTLLLMSPVDYIYDDHDFLNNNCSATTASFSVPSRPNPYGNDFIAREIQASPQGRLNSIRGYKENFPTYPLVNESRGIYHKFTFGNADVFMLDLRAQRSPNQNSLRKNPLTGRWEFAPPSGHSILGRENAPGSGQSQMSWFLSELQNSQATWKFVVSTVPFNIGQTTAILLGLFLQDSSITLPGIADNVSPIFAAMELADKWCGFPEDVQLVLNHVRNNNIRNVIMLSGDQHTAAMDDGANAGFPEIMAGGLDITNSRIVVLLEIFGLHIWNKGGQGITTNEFNNAFGRINVFGSDSVQLALVDESGTQFATQTVFNRPTGVVDANVIPKAYSLHQNYPNPFNPSTMIKFDLPEESFVTLSVYDVLGRKIATILSESRPQGSHSVSWSPGGVSSGVYYCVLEAGPEEGKNLFRESRKMILLR